MSITIKDIARLANVSTTTVSRVINNKAEAISEETKNKIYELIEKFDYKPNSIARSMVTKKTYTIGLIVPDITNPFFPGIARGVEDGANKHGYSVFLCNTDDTHKKEAQYISFLKEKYVDGLVLATRGEKNHGDILDKLTNSIPTVTLYRHANSDDSYGVYIDNIEGGYIATRHLTELGHRKIAALTGNIEMQCAKDRMNGYKKALSEAGIAVDESLILSGQYRVSSGAELMNKLLGKKKLGEDFTAVFVGDDLMAYGVYMAVKEKGYQIPDDISIVGFDNIMLSEMIDPPLTTINQPAYEIGKTAVDMLMKLIKNQRINKKVNIFDVNLVKRGSTKSLMEQY